MGDAANARYLKQLGLCIVLGFLAIPVYIRLFPVNFELRDYVVWKHQIDFATRPSVDDPELLILGDSRVQAAIVPERMGDAVRSLAFGSATPPDVWLLFERYLENHRAPRAVLLSFAPFHLLAPTSHDIFWVRTARYKLWPARDDLAFMARARELGVPLVEPELGHGAMLEWLLTRYDFPPYYLPALKNARLWGRRAQNLEAAREIARSRGHLFYGRLESSDGRNRDVHRDRFEASPLADAYLRDLLVRADAVGTEVFLVTMPMNRASAEALHPDFVAGYREYFERLAADFPRATIEPGIRALPNDHFGDRHHLNRRGAERLTDEYAARLRDWIGPEGPATELARRP